ncbi:MAG TPA: nuclear transport factor 2 family protein [Conexibacter sp.]|nr:nuclear transport factor 2 family protein [Conexibacter sp.]
MTQHSAGPHDADYAAIDRLLVRYAASLDQCDGPAFVGCFVDGKFTPDEVDKIMRFHAKYERTAHYVLNHAYEIEGTTATGTQHAFVTFVRNTAGTLTKFDMHVRYENDRLAKIDGEWLFTERTVEVIYSTPETPVQKGARAGFRDGLDDDSEAQMKREKGTGHGG